MKIRDIIQEKGRDVVTTAPEQPIFDAINKLNEHRIGALMVTEENGDIAGIITERDIMRVCGKYFGQGGESGSQDTDDSQALVRDSMTTDLVIGVLDDDLNYAMGVMTKNRIRHLPVLDDGKLAGIISIGDLVNAHFEEKVLENRTLREYIHGQMR
jgi:CBS domain-containing protein